MSIYTPEDREMIGKNIANSSEVELTDDLISEILATPEINSVMTELLAREKELCRERKIESTYKHSLDVAILVKVLADSGQVDILKNLLPENLKVLLTAAILHDIGKKDIDLELLNSKGKISDSQWEQFKSHPQKGFEICQNVCSNLPHSDLIAEIVLRHHSFKMNKSYPDSQSFHDFPQDSEVLINDFSRIIAIIDAFDSLRSERSYRQPEDDSREIRELLLNEFGQSQEPIISYLINYFMTKKI